jgi:general secretion pathway protein M
MRKMDMFPTLVRRYRQDEDFRRKALLVLALAGLTILLLPNLLWERSAERDLSALKKKYGEFSALAGEYRSLQVSIAAIERKKALTKTTTIAQAIGDISRSIGVTGKVKSIKGTGTRKTPNQMNEDTAEIQIEKLSINEVVQLVYKIENAPMILAMKTVVIKKSFEDPGLLDITLTVSLFTPAATS